MKRERTIPWLVIALLLLSISVTGCGQSTVEIKDAPSGEYTSEGEDTKLEITGYHRYQGEHGACFLSEGDKVAVISPSELPTREQVDATLEGLEAWGFVPVEGKYVCPATRTLDQQRRDLEWALGDPEIRAVFCVRVGYAASELMDQVSLDLIREAEKPIIGYSDITVYHSAWTAAGVPSIHAGMSAAFMDLPPECAEAERKMMLGEIPSYRCETDTPCVDGEASGVLIGGNLSTFVSVLHTAYDCTGMKEPYVLYLEDVDDNIREIHRYLTILKHMGVMDGASAILFGEWTMLPANDEANFGYIRGGAFESVADMIHREFLGDLDIPVAFGFLAGHGEVNYPLLMGETVHVSVSGGSYTVEWE